MAMAHSVEGRFPFLDYRVVEFASRLSPQLKMKVLNEKYLLKAAVGDLIPRSIRYRHKQPYRSPDSQSFLTGGTAGGKKGVLHEYAEELMAPRAIAQAGIFDPERVGKLVEKARAGEVIGVRDNMAFVGILSTQMVVDRFITNFPKEHTI